MFTRLPLLALLFGLVAAAPAAAQLPCVNPAADPCLINSSVDLATGIYDIRPKSLSLGNKQLTITGVGELQILANNITFQPGGRLVADGTEGNTTITLEATGTIDLQSQGTSKSKIDVSGNFNGGTINLHSVGDLSVNGTLIANASNTLGYGGPINVTSDTGNVTITGDPSEGLRSLGNAQGGGGTIAIEATLGAVSISTQIVAKGGDCSSCEIDLTAGTDLTTTAQGVIDMRASGVGDGGFFDAEAGGDVNLAGNILANGSSDDFDGGAGGDVLISSDIGSVTIGGRVEVNGAGQDAAPGSPTGSVDGDGGSSDISAGTFITINGPMFGISKGFGSSDDDFTFDAGTNLTLAGEIDVSADNFGNNITGLAEGVLTVSARIRTATPIDPVNKPGAFAGTIDLEACQINVTSTGQVVCTGPGGDPSGSNELSASTGLTVAGTLTATALNDLEWRTSAPIITGTVTPAATITNNLFLPCCGVQCPTTSTTTTSTTTTSTTLKPTTTSSTTTTSTITLPPTTSSSTAPVPTTTSSTSVGATTTSSTAPVPTTTTSTAIPTTTTSSTHAPTTTTIGATSTTSTTSTTVAGASTTTSSTTLATTTSTGASTTSTSSTTTSSPSSSSTVVPTTSSTSSTAVTASSSTSTVPATPTTSTTVPPTSCLDTALGIDAVRCRLDMMNELILGASETDLGGHKLAHQLVQRARQAVKLAAIPTSNKDLKKAAKQLKQISTKVGKALAKGKFNATLGAELSTLSSEGQAELAGLVTSG
jgi:hypothetical protein